MKFGIFLLLLFSTALYADVTIPQKLIDHHTAVCSDFGTEDGKYLLRAAYKLPKSPNSESIKTLYVLGCQMYAYNSLEKAYILDSEENITDVYVVEIDEERSLTATNDLMGSDYDEASNTLGTFQKGRGIGDCGSTATYTYSSEVEKFILVQARLKNHCDGDVESEWPVVYSK